MKPNKIIVKFEEVAEQVNGPVKRLVQLVGTGDSVGSRAANRVAFATAIQKRTFAEVRP